MYKETCEVIENRPVAPGHRALKFRSKKISKTALPGQFVQILCGGDLPDPLLPRPFSFLDASSGDFSLLYHVVGKGTGLMAHFKKGDKVAVLGPLGRGFTLSSELGARSSEARILVGGGVGIPPLHHLVKTWLKNKTVKKESIHVFLGAQNKSLLLCEKEFKKLGVHLSVATNDGSKGLKGFVPALLTSFLRAPSSEPPAPSSELRARIYSCGPGPMLKAVSLASSEFGVPCEMSVEVPMACGFGACLGCAIKVKTTVDSRQYTVDKEKSQSTVYRLPSTSFRYAIACTEGPVFQGSDILWD